MLMYVFLATQKLLQAWSWDQEREGNNQVLFSPVYIRLIKHQGKFSPLIFINSFSNYTYIYMYSGSGVAVKKKAQFFWFCPVDRVIDRKSVLVWSWIISNPWFRFLLMRAKKLEYIYSIYIYAVRKIKFYLSWFLILWVSICLFVITLFLVSLGLVFPKFYSNGVD